MRNIRILFYLLLFIISGCGVYSFTGASISPDVKTISFQNFFNNSPLGPSNMSVLFTEKIKDYFERNTSLTIVKEDGELEIGQVASLLKSIQPASIIIKEIVEEFHFEKNRILKL